MKLFNKNILSFDNCVISIFALRAVSFVWLAFATTQYMPLYSYIVFFLRYITIILGPIFLIKHSNLSDNKCNSAFYALIFYWIMLVFNTYGGYEGSYIHELVSIGCFLLMGVSYKIKIFNYFYKIILYCSFVSIIFYFAFLLGLPIGIETVPFLNDGVESSVYVKWFIFAIVGDGQYGLPRMCSIFNEPGALGTVMALLFAVTYPYSKRIEKTVLLVSCFLSFSVAGYVLVVLFYTIYYVSKNWKYIIPISVILYLFLMLPYIDFGNEYFNTFFSRFIYTGNGLAGDNRVNSTFEKLWQNFNNSNDVFFGRGATYGGESGASSYKNLIIQFGYVGIGIYFMLWFMSILRYIRGHKECITFFLVFLISIYQRPVTLTNAYGYTIVFGGIAALIAYKKTVSPMPVKS